MLQKDIGAKIRRLRKERKWSQEKLAVYSDLSVSTIRTIELGIANPTMETLQSIASALDVSDKQLFVD